MGRHVAGDAPEADRLVADSILAIGAEIDAAHVPRLLGVVLGAASYLQQLGAQPSGRRGDPDPHQPRPGAGPLAGGVLGAHR